MTNLTPMLAATLRARVEAMLAKTATGHLVDNPDELTFGREDLTVAVMQLLADESAARARVEAEAAETISAVVAERNALVKRVEDLTAERRILMVTMERAAAQVDWALSYLRGDGAIDTAELERLLAKFKAPTPTTAAE